MAAHPRPLAAKRRCRGFVLAATAAAAVAVAIAPQICFSAWGGVPRRLRPRTATEGATDAPAMLGFDAEAAAEQQPAAAAGAGHGRRGAALAVLASALATVGGRRRVEAFTPADLGQVDSNAGSRPTLPKKNSDPNRLKRALYLISRVQEATVQQERLVSTGKFKDMQRNNIKMALKMMTDNYALADSVVTASGYVTNSANVMAASTVGNEAVDALDTAKDYFAKELKVSGITDDQRSFLVRAMQATRDKLDTFLGYLPSDAVNAARLQVEEENALNVKEFVGEEGAIMNPVTLPWKK